LDGAQITKHITNKNVLIKTGETTATRSGIILTKRVAVLSPTKTKRGADNLSKKRARPVKPYQKGKS
jgi:hypothetical protein